MSGNKPFLPSGLPGCRYKEVAKVALTGASNSVIFGLASNLPTVHWICGTKRLVSCSFPIYQHQLIRTTFLSSSPPSSPLFTFLSALSSSLMQSSQFSSAHSLSSFAKAASRIPHASPCLTRSLSTVSRPYRFHTGASWAGKPSDPLTRPVNTAPFARDHPIGRWRDHVLSRPNPHWGKHIGEDFFYIQEVRFVQIHRPMTRYSRSALYRRCGASRYVTFCRCNTVCSTARDAPGGLIRYC